MAPAPVRGPVLERVLRLLASRRRVLVTVLAGERAPRNDRELAILGGDGIGRSPSGSMVILALGWVKLGPSSTSRSDPVA
jgi:hypothetical protein